VSPPVTARSTLSASETALTRRTRALPGSMSSRADVVEAALDLGQRPDRDEEVGGRRFGGHRQLGDGLLRRAAGRDHLEDVVAGRERHVVGGAAEGQGFGQEEAVEEDVDVGRAGGGVDDADGGVRLGLLGLVLGERRDRRRPEQGEEHDHRREQRADRRRHLPSLLPRSAAR
jgi:hypothetical protein